MSSGDLLTPKYTGSVRHQTTAGDEAVSEAAAILRWKNSWQYDDFEAGIPLTTDCSSANEYNLPSDLETISKYRIPIQSAVLSVSSPAQQPTLQTNDEGALFVCSYQKDTALIYGTARNQKFAALRPITQHGIDVGGNDTKIYHHQWLPVPQGPSVDASSLPEFARDVISNS